MNINKILISGSHGMVGHNLVDHLKSLSSACTLLTPIHKECELLDRTCVASYLSESKPDLIIHCAGTVGGIQANVSNPVKFLYENMQMGLNLVLEAFEHKIPRLINLGSSCMYPYAAPNPLKEEMVLSGALEPTNEGYALAKCAITRLCQYINHTDSSFQYKTLIPCNLYGPYDKFDERAHMIPAIIKKIDTAITEGTDTVEILGDGTARREFMYAGDLAQCIAMAIERFDDLPELMNIGLGYDYTVDEYYEKIRMILGYSGSFVHNTKKPSGMKQKLVDVSLQTKFGFKPKTSLEEGIRKTYEYYKTLQTK